MKTIAIYGNDCQGAHLDDLRYFFGGMVPGNVKVKIERTFAGYLRDHGLELPEGCETVDFPAEAALAVSIGGDGTFLHAAQWVGEREVPVMGINTGHLGYLAGFTLERPMEVRDALEGKGKVSVTSRMALEASSKDMPDRFYPYALNEVAVQKGDSTSMVHIRAYIDNHYLADYLSDGLVVATPTGSTAYNLSVGGPILEPTVENVVLSPIAPHSLTMRPLVIGAESEIRLEVGSRGKECHVSLDGRLFVVPSGGAEVRIRRARRIVRVMLPGDKDFARVLRDKLDWGKGNANFEF